METRFKSVNRPGIAYEILNYKTQLETYNRFNYLSSLIGEYECFDDGLVQHSPHIHVRSENFCDCLISLALFLEDKTDDNLLKLIDSAWPTDIYKDKIEFAKNLKYNPDKARYYSISDLKSSTSDKLRHDRRFEILPEYVNGSLFGICRLVIPDHSDGLHKYHYYMQIRYYLNYSEDIEGCFANIPGKSYDIDNSLLSSAHSIIDRIVKAYRTRNAVKRSYECLKNNLETRNGLKAA